MVITSRVLSLQVNTTYKILRQKRAVKVTTHSKMQPNPNIAILKDIFLSAVDSVQPQKLIGKITVSDRHLVIEGNKHALRKPCYLVGFGKAVLGMATELDKVLGPHLQRAVVTVPTGIFRNFPLLENTSKKIRLIEGAANNLPDENAMRGASEIKSLVEKLDEDDLLIVLISGGGSALLPLPIPPITLQEKHDLIKTLASKGANIMELNNVRKQISVLKGGGLARLAYPCRVISLILSDIVGDPLDSIASGATTPNCGSPDNAINIIGKYISLDAIPDSIKTVLERKSQFPEDVTPISNGQYEHVVNYIIGNNKIAADRAREQAVKYGFQSVVVSTAVEGDVNYITQLYVKLASHITTTMSDSNHKSILTEFLIKLAPQLKAPYSIVEGIINMDFSRKICLIFAGEPTVTVKGSGRGGRNQQLALAFGLELNSAQIASGNISFLSCGTDGIDGPTDAAGAIATSELFNNNPASPQNIKLQQYLDNNDSYRFFSQCNNASHLIRIGHTGTNVMDIHVMLIEPEDSQKEN